MFEDIASLLVPLGLIAGGYYIKLAKDREPHAGPDTWKWLIILGSVLFIIKLITFILKYS